MAQPTSLLGDVRGMSRDLAIDSLPPGYVWDLIDYIPNRRGARLEGRGPWKYLTNSSMGARIWSGKHASFNAGPKLLVWAGSTVYDHPIVPGSPTSVGTLFASGQQNGVMLYDRVYFADASGASVPKRVSWNGSSWTVASINAGAPKAKLIEVYKSRLIAAGDPANPQNLYFSPLETDPVGGPAFGPMGPWDASSYMGTPRAITALAPMSAQIITFHSKSIGKIRGGMPPATNVDTDMTQDLFSDQMGCVDPLSICNWQENVIFANSRGVHLTDGATIRSLTDQGSMGDFWRVLYSRKRSGTQVSAGVFLDFLLVTVLTDYTPPASSEQLPVTLVCNLNDRTWFRFKNFLTTCYIESESGVEEVWAGVDAAHRLTKVSDCFYGNIDLPEADVPPPTIVNAVDANGQAVLPFLDLGWKRLGREGVKRVRHAYLSHQSQTAAPGNVFEVEYRMNVGTSILEEDFLSAGLVPADSQYNRVRLNVGRRGYGIRVRVKQIAPSYLSRLYDVSVGDWPNDGARL